MTKVFCDKEGCKHHGKDGICKKDEIQIEDQGSAFSCNSCEDEWW